MVDHVRVDVIGPVVEVRDLHVRFGDVEAVAGVDLAAYAGGRRRCSGATAPASRRPCASWPAWCRPTAGTVRVAGHDVRTHPLDAKRAVGYCPDVGGLVPRATAWEHLQLSARLRRLHDWEPRARDLLERFELGDAATG